MGKQQGKGPEEQVSPTRKRPGTLLSSGGKRRKTSVASEKELSEVAGPKANGPVSHQMNAEGDSSFSSGHHEGDSTRSGTAEKHGSVLLLDVFCGTAGVAAAFIQLGGEALGLDHIVDKKRVRGPVSKVDLCKQENQDMVLKWLDGKIDAVMLAPPCGTSSRAREIPIFQSGKKRKAPRPLRSNKWPDGLPHLRGLDATKVRLANKLYQFTRKVIDKCLLLDVPFICENPQRSWMWATSFFQGLRLSVASSPSIAVCTAARG